MPTKERKNVDQIPYPQRVNNPVCCAPPSPHIQINNEQDIERKNREIEASRQQAATAVRQEATSRFVNGPGLGREVERIGQQVGGILKAFKFW